MRGSDEPRGDARRPNRRGLAARCGLAALLALAGCGSAPVATPSSGEADPGEEPIELSAERAAFAAARLAVELWPSADPCPIAGSAPVLLVDDDVYRIELRLGTDGPRIATNGRLSAPRTVLKDGDRVLTTQPIFRAARAETRAVGDDGRFLCIVSRTGTGCRVAAAADGEAARSGVLRRLRAVLSVQVATTHVTAALDAGDLPRAAACANQAIRLHAARGDACGQAMLAPLWAAIAAVRLRSGECAAARAALRAACDVAREEPLYALLLARVDERLARSVDHGSLDAALARLDDPRDALAARARNADEAHQTQHVALGERIAARSRRLLALGDVASAEAWATRLRASAPAQSAIDPQQRARARGDRRAAFVLGVEALTQGGFDPGVLAATVDDAIAGGDAIGGLRLLARHWPTTLHDDPELGRALASRLLEATGGRLGARVALSEDCAPLAQLALADRVQQRDVAAALRTGELRRRLELGAGAGEALAAPGR
jgi:hypothetical protein